MLDEIKTFKSKDEVTSDSRSQFPNIGLRVYIVSGMYEGQYGYVTGYNQIGSSTFVVIKLDNGIVDNFLPVEFVNTKDR